MMLHALQALGQFQIHSVVPFNPVDKKTSADVTGPDGSSFVTCKGAPQVRSSTMHFESTLERLPEWHAQVP